MPMNHNAQLSTVHTRGYQTCDIIFHVHRFLFHFNTGQLPPKFHYLVDLHTLISVEQLGGHPPWYDVGFSLIDIVQVQVKVGQVWLWACFYAPPDAFNVLLTAASIQKVPLLWSTKYRRLIPLFTPSQGSYTLCSWRIPIFMWYLTAVEKGTEYSRL